MAAVAVAVPLLLMASASATPVYPVTRVADDRTVDPTALHAAEISGNTIAAGKTIVSTSQVAPIFDGGATAIGWSTSVDGGKTFKNGLVPSTIASAGSATLTRGNDPVVAYDARFGEWLINSIGISGNNVVQSLLVNRSTDGKTWGNPIVTHAASAPGDVPDKNWVTCDNWPSSSGYGNCYVVYDNTGAGTQLLTQRSTDGGLTWSAPVANSGETATTTLSAAAAVLATNIKVASVANLTVGQTIIVDSTGANPESVVISAVGTAGAGGTGVTFAPALAFAHASGATVSEPTVPAPATGTGAVPLVQPPVSSGTCGRVVVPYTGGGGLSQLVSTDCGVSYGPHTVITTQTATHTVAQGFKTSLLASDSMDKNGAIYLTWQTRSFRIASTTLSAAASSGDMNIKVASVTNLAAGQTLTIDPANASKETVTIATVGTSGATGTGVTLTSGLLFAHASGAIVNENAVPSTSTAAPNDIAMAVMPGPTAATPAPTFGAAARIPIEADNGQTSNTNDHFIPAIAVDHNTAGATAHLGLFYYTYPVAACIYDDPFGPTHCYVKIAYVSSKNGGSTWSTPQFFGTMSLAWLPRLSGGPAVGNYLGADVVGSGPLTGNAFSAFAVAYGGNSTHQELDVPTHGLAITSP